MQTGIVIRRNEVLGITEDCWRLVYPRDLQVADGSNTTLGAFLAAFFPQLRSVFARLAATGDGLSNVVVKYYSHKIEPPVTHAPLVQDNKAYQTIGTLDESCQQILTRYVMI